jgi:hypothetical protein
MRRAKVKSLKSRSPEVTRHDDVTQGDVDFLSPATCHSKWYFLMTLLDQKKSDTWGNMSHSYMMTLYYVDPRKLRKLGSLAFERIGVCKCKNVEA